MIRWSMECGPSNPVTPLSATTRLISRVNQFNRSDSTADEGQTPKRLSAKAKIRTGTGSTMARMTSSPRRRAATAFLVLVALPATGGCGSADPQETRRERDGRAVVAVVGDSYMAGFGVTSADEGMAVLMADRLDMDLANFAVGGTGYVNGGQSGTQSYAVQANSAVAADANLYLVEGALNDWQAIYQAHTSDLDALSEAARSLYKRLVDATGAGNVIVVGPIWPYDESDAGIGEVNDVLKREAAAAGLDYIDPLEEGWITPDNNNQYIGPDLAHPSTLGHIYLARKLAAAVRSLR